MEPADRTTSRLTCSIETRQLEHVNRGQFRGVTYLDSVAFGRVCPNERDTRRDDVSILVLLTGPVDTGNLSSSNDLELLCNSNYRDNLEVSTESLSKQSRKTSTTHGSQSK